MNNFFTLFFLSVLIPLSIKASDSTSIYLNKYKDLNTKELYMLSSSDNLRGKIAKYYMAKEQFYANNFSEAYKIFKSLIDNNNQFSKDFNYKLQVNIALTCVELQNYKEAETYFFLAENSIKKTNDKEEKAKLGFDIGQMYSKNEQYLVAGNYLRKAELIFKEINNPEYLSNIYLELGAISQYLNLHSIAIQYYKNAEKISFEHNFTENYINSLINIGNERVKLKEYEQAALVLNKALEKSKNNNYTKGIIYSLNLIAQLFTVKNDNKNALKFLQQSKAYLTKTNEYETKLMILNNLGVTYKYLHNYNQALFYFKKVSDLLVSKNTTKNTQQLISLNIAEIHFLKKEFKLATKYLKLCKSNTTTNTLSLKASFLESQIYMSQNKYFEALEILQEIENKTSNYDDLKLKSGVFLRLSEVYSAINNYSLSLNYYKKYEKIQQKIKEEAYSFQLAKLENDSKLNELTQQLHKFKYKTELQKQKINFQQKISISLIIGIVVFLAFSLVLLWLYKKLKTSNKELLKRNIEFSKQIPFEQEKNELKTITSINPKDKKLIESLIVAFETEKLYLNKGINLNELAVYLETNRTYLSAAIQSVLRINFTGLINKYRIYEARKILTIHNQVLSIEGIAHEVGFNSKSAFHTAFKKHTGVTPAEFHKEVLVSGMAIDNEAALTIDS